jgi:hypothetical protein
MIFVVLRSGKRVDVVDAVGVRVLNGELVLRDAEGRVLQRFKAREVTAYGKPTRP